MEQTKKRIILSFTKLISPARTDVYNPFGMQRLFFGITIFPTIAIIFSTVSQNATDTEYIVRIIYCAIYFFLSLVLISRITKLSHNYTQEEYNKITTDQMVFTVIFVVGIYTAINYFACLLLIGLAT